MTAPRQAFASVVFDVDSTLTGVEGVNWLAERRGTDTAQFVVRLTNDVMAGRTPIEDAYAARLERIAPTRTEVQELAQAYRDAAAPDAAATVSTLVRSGIRVVAVSGGLAGAVVPFCATLGIAEPDVHAVRVDWDDTGRYVGFDRASPLVTQVGKAVVLRKLGLPKRVLAVGDGSTDAELKRVGAVDAFAAYVAFARRERVVAVADFVVERLAEVVDLVRAPA